MYLFIYYVCVCGKKGLILTILQFFCFNSLTILKIFQSTLSNFSKWIAKNKNGSFFHSILNQIFLISYAFKVY